MTERPILFSGPMVRAILEGRKTQTRRAMRPQPTEDFRVLAVEWYEPTVVDRHGEEQPGKEIFGVYGDEEGYKCPYGAPGDRLWVREAWAQRLDRDHLDGAGLYAAGVREAWYWADGPGRCCRTGCAGAAGRVRAARFMPRWASRIALDVTAIRVERLQAITLDDAKAEGVTHYRCGHPDCIGPKGEPGLHAGPRGAYMELWEDINGKGSWDTNPWVWVIEFKRAS
jgi:hypothetical protein